MNRWRWPTGPLPKPTANNEVILPWPDKALSPNARIHWAQRAKAVKAYRQACWALTKEAGLTIDWEGYIYLWLTFYPPDRRARDDDNLIASFKGGRDGMAQALGVDDKRFRLYPWVADHSEDMRGMVRAKLSQGPTE